MSDMEDRFNQGQPARGAPTRTAADPVAEAAARARAAMTPQQTPLPPPVPPIDYNEFGQVMLNVLAHHERMKQQEQERQEAMKPKPPPVTVQKVAESATPDEIKKRFEEEDKMGAPLNVADRPFTAMEKEPVAIITATLVLLSLAGQWFGVTVSATEMDELIVGINAMVSAVVLVAGTVAGIIARSKVNSPATVAKAKKEGKL